MNHEPPSFLTRISNGEQVDLSSLTPAQALRLHYDEEKYTAEKISAMPPFSPERPKFLSEAYKLAVNPLKEIYYAKSTTTKIKDLDSNGARTILGLVCEFIAQEQDNIMLYEAGVGGGASLKKFLEYPNVSIRGCDVVLYDSVKELIRSNKGRISIDEESIYDSLLKLDDNSIDIFFADNVFEHMLPDEFPEIMKVLAKKLKHGALLFLLIPNRVNGPHDISHFFLKMGQKAEGFHFMEQTYHEVTESYRHYGIYPAYFVYKNLFKKYKYIKDNSGILNKFKLFLENLAWLIPGRYLRSKFVALTALSTYIIKKK